MYTVSQVARAIDVSVSTVRQWSGEFTAHLSDKANPPKGETRFYSDEDVATLRTVAVLRDSLVDYDEIHERLDAGERLEPPDMKEPGEEQEEAPGSALVTESFAQALQAQDNQITTLLNRLQEAQNKLVDAEKRASAAETRADMLQARLDEIKATGGEKKAQEPAQEEDRRPWWAFWKG